MKLWLVFRRMMKTNDNYKKEIGFAVMLCIIVAAFGWLLCRYYANRANSDSNDAIRTVQQVERDNKSARDANTEADSLNESVGAELDAGQADLSGATESVGRLQNSSSERTELIRTAKEGLADSQRLIDEERSLFADIDEANQGARK